MCIFQKVGYMMIIRWFKDCFLRNTAFYFFFSLSTCLLSILYSSILLPLWHLYPLKIYCKFSNILLPSLAFHTFTVLSSPTLNRMYWVKQKLLLQANCPFPISIKKPFNLLYILSSSISCHWFLTFIHQSATYFYVLPLIFILKCPNFSTRLWILWNHGFHLAFIYFLWKKFVTLE